MGCGCLVGSVLDVSQMIDLSEVVQGLLLDPECCKWWDAGGGHSDAYPDNVPLAPAEQLLVLLGLVLGN